MNQTASTRAQMTAIENPYFVVIEKDSFGQAGAFYHPNIGGTFTDLLYVTHTTARGFVMLTPFKRYTHTGTWHVLTPLENVNVFDEPFKNEANAMYEATAHVQWYLNKLVNVWTNDPVTPEPRRNNNPKFSKKAERNRRPAMLAYSTMHRAMRLSRRLEAERDNQRAVNAKGYEVVKTQHALWSQTALFESACKHLAMRKDYYQNHMINATERPAPPAPHMLYKLVQTHPTWITRQRHSLRARSRACEIAKSQLIAKFAFFFYTDGE